MDLFGEYYRSFQVCARHFTKIGGVHNRKIGDTKIRSLLASSSKCGIYPDQQAQAMQKEPRKGPFRRVANLLICSAEIKRISELHSELESLNTNYINIDDVAE